MSVLKGLPFVFKGVVAVGDCKTSQEVMTKAGLDWEVKKCETVAQIYNDRGIIEPDHGFVHGSHYYKEVPNNFAIYRDDNLCPLGSVKGRYTIVQNRDAFSFFDRVIGEGKAAWDTAGCFGNGERIFVSAKLPIVNVVKGYDPIDNYLVFTSTHDGSGGVKILFSPNRVVCKNTLNAAIRNAQNYVSFRHTNGVHNKIDMADQVLGVSDYLIANTKVNFDKMYDTPVSDEQAYNIFANLILTAEEILNIKDTGHTIKKVIEKNYGAITDVDISAKKINTLHNIAKYYEEGIGQRNIIGNGWGVYNAVTGYYSNIDNAVGLKRMDSLLYGDKSRKIKEVGDAILYL